MNVTTYCSSPAQSCQPAAESRALSHGECQCGMLTLHFLGNLGWLCRRWAGSGVSRGGRETQGRARPAQWDGHLEMWPCRRGRAAEEDRGMCWLGDLAPAQEHC